MIHWNELPWKRLFCKINGVTLGPKTYSGTIGKRLENCENLDVQFFQPIYTDDVPVLNKSVISDLSADQMYLYEIIK